MVKRWIRRAVIFFGIAAIVPLCHSVYSSWVSVSWMFARARDGQALASTWLDTNANGKRDADEQPLPYVCVWGSYSVYGEPLLQNRCDYSRTDAQGIWGEFLPGGSCSDFFVIASSPAGYHATTDLVSNGCQAEFGFVQDSVPVNHKVLSVREYIEQRDKQQTGTRIVIALAVVVAAGAGTIWLEKLIESTPER